MTRITIAMLALVWLAACQETPMQSAKRMESAWRLIPSSNPGKTCSEGAEVSRAYRLAGDGAQAGVIESETYMACTIANNNQAVHDYINGL
jgi:hypothetical protein